MRGFRNVEEILAVVSLPPNCPVLRENAVANESTNESLFHVQTSVASEHSLFRSHLPWVQFPALFRQQTLLGDECITTDGNSMESAASPERRRPFESMALAVTAFPERQYQREGFQACS